ncbi:hypothetical protein TNCV_324911 [Trichonephila clavipes]|nr:hypothetical protein TNCV_324911 [Trichonephila clavipes]
MRLPRHREKFIENCGGVHSNLGRRSLEYPFVSGTLGKIKSPQYLASDESWNWIKFKRYNLVAETTTSCYPQLNGFHSWGFALSSNGLAAKMQRI